MSEFNATVAVHYVLGLVGQRATRLSNSQSPFERQLLALRIINGLVVHKTSFRSYLAEA